ncbi:hypothetical protein BZA05DRAFT_87390 [Tricharina praecox]|uniref:uncharacterized protein n=1 Tax=Tricharina praecox TaxID=43433 RepID=UPI0022204FA6|nr:uncharacterized protein BZA05DRAFT_87390 [Tricharina praecox]KAI5848802.1 hypothetical protein BZA05DRAFT_87390 [Tricharina praecox]
MIAGRHGWMQNSGTRQRVGCLVPAFVPSGEAIRIPDSTAAFLYSLCERTARVSSFTPSCILKVQSACKLHSTPLWHNSAHTQEPYVPPHVTTLLFPIPTSQLLRAISFHSRNSTNCHLPLQPAGGGGWPFDSESPCDRVAAVTEPLPSLPLAVSDDLFSSPVKGGRTLEQQQQRTSERMSDPALVAAVGGRM